MDDISYLSAEYTYHWAVSGYKEYQAMENEVHAIVPRKKPENVNLDHEDPRQNDRISSDRVIVENYFGRLGTLWTRVGSKYRWDSGSYDFLFKLCLSLTNIHICWHSHRQGDGSWS